MPFTSTFVPVRLLLPQFGLPRDRRLENALLLPRQKLFRLRLDALTYDSGVPLDDYDYHINGSPKEGREGQSKDHHSDRSDRRQHSNGPHDAAECRVCGYVVTADIEGHDAHSGMQWEQHPVLRRAECPMCGTTFRNESPAHSAHRR
jgi:rubredoxin